MPVVNRRDTDARNVEFRHSLQQIRVNRRLTCQKVHWGKIAFYCVGTLLPIHLDGMILAASHATQGHDDYAGNYTSSGSFHETSWIS